MTPTIATTMTMYDLLEPLYLMPRHGTTGHLGAFQHNLSLLVGDPVTLELVCGNAIYMLKKKGIPNARAVVGVIRREARKHGHDHITKGPSDGGPHDDEQG
jgi:hypothetical protein